MEDIGKLLAGQDGVVSQRQARAAGMADHDVRRMLRRREWVQVHPGVYLDHTGAPTWVQRAWAGVLSVWPAALSHASAIRAADGPGRRQHDDSLPVQVAVDRRRSPVAPAGVILHHLADLEAKVQWNLGPPRVRIEQAVVDVAAEAPTTCRASRRWPRRCSPAVRPPSGSELRWTGGAGSPAAPSWTGCCRTSAGAPARCSSTVTSTVSSARTACPWPADSSPPRHEE